MTAVTVHRQETQREQKNHIPEKWAQHPEEGRKAPVCFLEGCRTSWQRVGWELNEVVITPVREASQISLHNCFFCWFFPNSWPYKWQGEQADSGPMASGKVNLPWRNKWLEFNFILRIITTGTCFLFVFHLNKSSNKYFILICRPRKTLSLETTNFNLLVQQTLARAIYFSFHNQF